MSSIKRGDVYYVRSYYTTGSEQQAGRPAIIVSNNKNNQHSATFEVVYLTTQRKNDLPTHVTIRSLERESTALCEQVTTVSNERIGDYYGHITDTEMSNIDTALLISLDLVIGPVTEKVVEVVKEVNVEVPVEVPVELPAPFDCKAPDSDDGRTEIVQLKIDLASEQAKCQMIQQMYDALLSKIVK